MEDQHFSQKSASCNKSVDILQQTSYQQTDIRMRSHGLRQLVDDKSALQVIKRPISKSRDYKEGPLQSKKRKVLS